MDGVFFFGKYLTVCTTLLNAVPVSTGGWVDLPLEEEVIPSFYSPLPGFAT